MKQSDSIKQKYKNLQKIATNFYKALKEAVIQNDKLAVDILFPTDCETALMFACENPAIDEEILKSLSLQVLCVDQNGSTAMKRAIDANNTNAIRILSNKDVEPKSIENFEMKSKTKVDEYGRTSLLIATIA